MSEPRSPDDAGESNGPRLSAADAPIAIVGMACRFPGANGIDAFWRLLEAGGNAVLEGIPGSGIGRVGALFPDDTGQIDACRFGAYLDRPRPFRRRLLPDFAGGSAIAGPAAKADSGDELASARRRGHRPRSAEGKPYRRLCGYQQQRLPGPDPGGQRECGARRTRRQSLRGHRHVAQHGDRPDRVRAGPRGARDGGGHRLLVVVGRDAPGGYRPAAGRRGSRARGRK